MKKLLNVLCLIISIVVTLFIVFNYRLALTVLIFDIVFLVILTILNILHYKRRRISEWLPSRSVCVFVRLSFVPFLIPLVS